MFRSLERRPLVKNLTVRTKKPMPRKLAAAWPSQKWLSGKVYLVTQAYVSVEADLASPQKGVGLIFDKESGREYALAIADFNRFIETGDASLLPKESTPPTKVRTLQLKELRSRADG
jgi:hypothetical protein